LLPNQVRAAIFTAAGAVNMPSISSSADTRIEPFAEPLFPGNSPLLLSPNRTTGTLQPRCEQFDERAPGGGQRSLAGTGALGCPAGRLWYRRPRNGRLASGCHGTCAASPWRSIGGRARAAYHHLE
jgi:hypothetical protein